MPGPYLIDDTRVYEDFSKGLLTVICECLEQNSRLGAPEEIFPYHTTPPADCCDFLSVSIESAFAYRIGQFPLVLDAVEPCEDIGMGIDWSINLFRPCWPMATAHPTNPFPDKEATTQATLDLWQDLRVMTCCVLEHFEYLEECQGPCNSIVPGQVRPYPPDGGCAGWRWDLKVEFERCCT